MKKFLQISSLLTVLVVAFSCSSSSNDDDGGGTPPAEPVLTISADNQAVFVGETVTLKAKYNGEDVTAQTTFYVENEAITGNTFSEENLGYYKVSATYGELSSEKDLSVLFGYSQKVLIEDYTGAWCGWCPRVAYGIELVEAQTDNAIPVAIHRGAESGSYYDPFNYPAEDLEDALDISTYPTAMINRTTSWTYPEPNNLDDILDQAALSAPQRLAISSTLNGNALSVSVDVESVEDVPTGYKLVVYVLEDGLIADQTNYTDYYGGVSVLEDFEHNHVLRQVPTGLLGESITASDLDSNTGIYTKSFSFDLDSSIQDTSKLSVVSFVVNTNGAATNSQSTAVGETVGFDE